VRRNLVWLASFPKSGNTWLRFLLVNYLLNRDKPVGLDEISRYSFSDTGVRAFTKVAGRPVGTLSDAEIMALRPSVQRFYAQNPADVVFVKTHSMVADVEGTPTIDSAVTRNTLHVVRNPMDVAVSFANHYGCSLDKAVESLCRDTLVLRGNPKRNLLSVVGSWSANNASWINSKALKVLTLRYEDMQADTTAALDKALVHIGLEPDASRIAAAVGFSSFERLSRQEAETGFSEAARDGGRFFRAGKSGEGARKLGPDLIARLWDKHEAMITHFGYKPDFERALKAGVRSDPEASGVQRG
jgi:hypothetical protein